MIDRRTFVAGAALIAVAPAFELSSAQIPANAPNIGGVALMIDGWSVSDESNVADAVWIRIGRSWRTAWR